MIPFVAWLEDPARAAVQAFINGAWQGLLLTMIVALVLRAVRQTSAATRHVIWCATLVVVVARPLTAVPHHRAPSGPASPAANGSSAAVLPAESAATRQGATPTAYVWIVRAPSGPWLVFLLGAASLLAVIRLGRLIVALRNLRQLKCGSKLLPVSHRVHLESVLQTAGPGRAPDLRLSNVIRTPITVGFVHPAILIPARLLTELDGKALAQIILHELAHVRRRDDWTNLAQRVIEAVFFFHPAVLWIGRQLDIEREFACDDYAVAMLPGERSYAQCLTRLAELAVASRSAALAPGAAPRTSQLSRRVHALLAPNRPRSIQLSAAQGLASAVVLIAGVAALTSLAPVMALAGMEPSPAPLTAISKSTLLVAGPRTSSLTVIQPNQATDKADTVLASLHRHGQPAPAPEASRPANPEAVELRLTMAEPVQSSAIALEPADVPARALPMRSEAISHTVAASEPIKRTAADVRLAITLQVPSGSSLEDSASFLPAGHGARYSALPNPGSITRPIGRGIKIRITGGRYAQPFAGPARW